jgi:hypothetical protein
MFARPIENFDYLNNSEIFVLVDYEEQFNNLGMKLKYIRCPMRRQWFRDNHHNCLLAIKYINETLLYKYTDIDDNGVIDNLGCHIKERIRKGETLKSNGSMVHDPEFSLFVREFNNPNNK